MRKYLAPAFIVLLAITPMSAAFAASTTPAAATTAAEQAATGVVKYFNTGARSLELEDGTWFYLPIGYKAPDVKVGQKVTVHWQQNGTAREVANIEIG